MVIAATADYLIVKNNFIKIDTNSNGTITEVELETYGLNKSNNKSIRKNKKS